MLLSALVIVHTALCFRRCAFYSHTSSISSCLFFLPFCVLSDKLKQVLIRWLNDPSNQNFTHERHSHSHLPASHDSLHIFRPLHLYPLPLLPLYHSSVPPSYSLPIASGSLPVLLLFPHILPFDSNALSRYDERLCGMIAVGGWYSYVSICVYLMVNDAGCKGSERVLEWVWCVCTKCGHVHVVYAHQQANLVRTRRCGWVWVVKTPIFCELNPTIARWAVPVWILSLDESCRDDGLREHVRVRMRCLYIGSFCYDKYCLSIILPPSCSP